MAPWGRISQVPRIITCKGAHQTLNWTILCVQEINLYFLSHWDLWIILASSIIYPDKHMNRTRSFLIWSAAGILSMNKLYAQLHKILCMYVCMVCVCVLLPMLFLIPFSLLSGLDSKEFVCNVGGLGSLTGSGRSPGEGSSLQRQYSCLENHFNRGALWAITLIASHIVHAINCMFVSPHNFYIQTYSPGMMVFGGRIFGRWLGHEDGILLSAIVPL